MRITLTVYSIFSKLFQMLFPIRKTPGFSLLISVLSVWMTITPSQAQLNPPAGIPVPPDNRLALEKETTKLTSDDIKNNHLILWGDPSSNTILGRIQESLPISWSKEQFELNGKQYHSGTNIPVLIYPNPLNTNRYVVINSSFTFSEFSGGTNSLQIPKLPDWAVIDMSVPRDKRHPHGVAAAGFFDEHWRLKNN